MLGGDWSDAAQAEVFIDRDGDLFRHILRFLRASPEGKARVQEGLSPFEKTALVEEAMFYQLHKLQRLLKGTASANSATHKFKAVTIAPNYPSNYPSKSLDVTDISIADAKKLNALLTDGWRIAGCTWQDYRCFVLLMT